MILTKLQAAAALATLRAAPLGSGEAVRVSYNFPEGRIVSVVLRDPNPTVRVNEYTPDTNRTEAYSSVVDFAKAYRL